MNGYWQRMAGLLDHMVAEGFVKPEQRPIAEFVESPGKGRPGLRGRGRAGPTPPTIIADWRDVPAAARGATLALGNFDGVHRGHRAVLAAAHAGRPDAPLAALTFEPHPREHFRPDDPPFRLTLLPAKAAVLGEVGASLVVALPFDAAFAAMTAEAFVERCCTSGWARGTWPAARISPSATAAAAMSPPGTAGRGGRDRPDRGAAGADAQGPISSTPIRRLLQDGYPERARRARPAVGVPRPGVHGDKLGRVLGWPTANSGWAGTWSRRAASMP